jgi:hypothetical protein
MSYDIMQIGSNIAKDCAFNPAVPVGDVTYDRTWKEREDACSLFPRCACRIENTATHFYRIRTYALHAAAKRNTLLCY